jgi:hypothetical protein
VRARNIAYLPVLDDLAARDINGAEIFRAGRVAVRLGCHHRDMAMSVIDVRLDPPLLDALRRRADAEGVSVNELVRRLVRDGLSREHEARAVGPSAPAAEPAAMRKPACRGHPDSDAPGKNRTCARGLGSTCSSAQPCGFLGVRASLRAKPRGRARRRAALAAADQSPS